MTGTDVGTATRMLILLLGFWLLMRSISRDQTGRTLIDRIVGNPASKSPLLAVNITGSAPAATAPGSGATTGTTGVPVPNAKGLVNPFPGATGSRLDQGFDLNAVKQVLAPFTGKILVADSSNAGWGGGGYIAIQNASDPSQVMYVAENVAPVVQVGQTIQAGQPIGIGAAKGAYGNPAGSIEAGWASPSSPGQPLAQVSSNKPSVATSFYNFIRGLGGPAATTTSGAGFP